jgi:DNA topoisomerase-1
MIEVVDGLEEAGLRYLRDDELVIRRERAGKGFRYRGADGGRITAAAALARLSALAIPPAWTHVRIAADPSGHLQAMGRDARGRRQYVYHPEWRRLQQQHKFDKLVAFGAVLPAIRAQVRADLALKGLVRQRVIATVVWLLDQTFIRVGNPEYARHNGSYGLTTLREKHDAIAGAEVRFEFTGKGGICHAVSIRHPRVARTIRKCIELPGYELFQYLDDAGARHEVLSRDVNDYLRAVAGDDFTAKDFRTWGGTVLAGATLYHLGPPATEAEAKAGLLQTVRHVARQLGNTAAVCRQYYIHPAIGAGYASGALARHYARVHARSRPRRSGLHVDEHAAWTFIKRRRAAQSMATNVISET